jgi:hypothetical protein
MLTAKLGLQHLDALSRPAAHAGLKETLRLGKRHILLPLVHKYVVLGGALVAWRGLRRVSQSLQWVQQGSSRGASAVAWRGTNRARILVRTCSDRRIDLLMKRQHLWLTRPMPAVWDTDRPVLLVRLHRLYSPLQRAP